MRLTYTILLVSLALFSSAQNTVSTFAGDGTPGLKNGTTDVAQFISPFGMCRDKKGSIYIADAGNNCVRKIDAAGNVTTLAGSPTAGYKNGQGTAAKFNQPFCLCVDDSGNIYVSDFMNQRIRKITPAGNVSTIAGSGMADYKDDADTLADFNYPRGITIDKHGNLYIADSWNHRIRKIDGTNHAVTTVAGGGLAKGVQSIGDYIDATDTAARFYTPSGVAVDGDGNIYVADAYNHRIRKIDTLHNVTTVAGSGATGSGNGGFANGHATTIAKLNTPTDLFWTAGGDLLIGDTYNNRVRLLKGGIVSTVAGNGDDGFINGDADSAEFSFPRTIAANATSDSIWVVDSRNNVIRLIAISSSGISKLTEEKLLLFPNPVNGILHIQLPDDGIHSVKITDNLGRLIYHVDNVARAQFNFDTSGILSGIYLISLEGNNKVFKTKIIRATGN